MTWWKKDVKFTDNQDPECRYMHRYGPELLADDAMAKSPGVAGRRLEYGWVIARINGKTLDVGTGDSRLAPVMARHANKLICCDPVDFTQFHRDLQVNTTKYEFIHAKLDEITYDDFDTISCISVIEHVTDDGAFVVDLRRRLAPGGTILMTMPYTHHIGKVDKHHCNQQRYYSMRDVSERILRPADLFITDINFIHYNYPGEGSRLAPPNDAGIICLALQAKSSI